MWEERLSSSVARKGNRIAVYESTELYLTTGPGIKGNLCNCITLSVGTSAVHRGGEALGSDSLLAVL